ncbi:MAG: phosphomannomutase [Porticoccaceae bacterium]|jgi:phosphomannomutase / phosphoglucomutase|nr:phosphomannomutase [Porticoccaceae bacterium]
MSLFKAYDLRGKVPEDLNTDIAYKIGRAYCDIYQPNTLAVGYDIRLESPMISDALMRGLVDGGATVINIGLSGTEEVYFATFNGQLDGGIMVTASHNPKGHNGMKLVKQESRPISADTGLLDIKALVETKDYSNIQSKPGSIREDFDKTAYIEHLLSYIDQSLLTPLKIVANPGNGGAGIVLEQLEKHLPFEFIHLNSEANGDFPNGVPNPLLLENQKSTAELVISSGADLGIAWDGDFDRCFFFDADGRFIEGYYLVGLLAEMMLLKSPNSGIVHDPRLVWNTQEQTEQAGGKAILSKCGHAFIKEIMREQDAVYGGEMSAHHYFRDFAYCDSGMIPWLLITELMCRTGQSLKELVDERIQAFPCSGEINFTIENAAAAIERVNSYYSALGGEYNDIDGISYSFADWRFNLRSSNTEPLVRLNVETRGDEALLEEKVAELEAMLR